MTERRVVRRTAIAFGLVSALLAGCLSGSHGTEDRKWGPFRGRFVDADTGEPIAGAVAYAIWLRNVPGLVHGTQRFEDVRFAVANGAGAFHIPERSPSLVFASGLEGPLFSFAAPGHQLISVDDKDRMEYRVLFRSLNHIPEGERSYIHAGLHTSFIPEQRRREILDTINIIRDRMGLPPFRTLGGL